jgi:superfamily II RNA helicase
MVKVCSNTYNSVNEIKYKDYFEKYPFPLSSFQKYAIEAIIEGNHILVTAHTGSGKTLPGEFAIEHFVAQGKKVIYTSPIKALSNQKYYEFSQKFPHISFGILTGDIKTNPEADVLIMTTEILQNTLYRKCHKSNFDNETNMNMAALSMFDMDIDNELGCVIFDEVHYINDQDRGKVWEETIMMLPLHIQMVMLSATLDAPEKFALWCETRGNKIDEEKKPKKTVYLTTTYERVVPLTHYSFITTTQGAFKAIKDKELQREIKETTNKLFPIQSSKGEFDEPHYYRMKKTLKLLENNRVFIKRSHVINQVCKYMFDNNMLPAICFVLSRKQLEICAQEVTVNLLEDDSKVPYIVRKECENIIRKLPNHEEYFNLPEFTSMISLLEKGIAIHHAGIMPVLREMVEMLFAKGYIKILFATETFAVGINMPTKTVVFTDVNKFDGSRSRTLYSHEYTQMAGRAGRRGIDTVGNVIHLNNLFRNLELSDYKIMMQGKPQKLTSKFRISYNLLLNLIDIGDQHFLDFVERSMIKNNIDDELGVIYRDITQKETDFLNTESALNFMKTPRETLLRYIELKDKITSLKNKKRKDAEREMSQIKEECRNLDADLRLWSSYQSKQAELDGLRNSMSQTEMYLNNNVTTIVNYLINQGFIEKMEDEYKLTRMGAIATHLRETHCLVFSHLLADRQFDTLSSIELACIFSCFTNVTVNDEQKTFTHRGCQLNSIGSILDQVQIMYNKHQDFETTEMIQTGIDYQYHFDLVDATHAWCKAENAAECKYVIQKLEENKSIFLGEFVKAILKINNISSEMEKIAESLGDIALLSKLQEIPQLTQKFVATNQSLYV